MRFAPVGLILLTAIRCILTPGVLNAQWSGYGRDAQHTANSTVPSQALQSIHWQTPVDLNPPGGIGSGPLYIHYGSPILTTANTVVVPVKTGAADGFELLVFSRGSTTPSYTLASDYRSPSHNWIPPYGPVLAIRNRLYYPGAGGTVYYRDTVDTATGVSGQTAFYGNANYIHNPAAFNSAVQICTPIATDRDGSIYFGFVVNGSNPGGLNLASGIAKITLTGVGSWAPVSSFNVNNKSITQPALNAAPALSIDQKTLYVVAATASESGTGYLVSLNTSTLAPIGHVQLLDPQGGLAVVTSDSSAAPMVGPDGDVYFGVIENGYPTAHNDRGWMLHYDSMLSQTKIPGSFGWDNTASVVMSSLVPSYTGTSSYLILTKYNNYAGVGSGDGVNRVAVLDPNASMPDKYHNPAFTGSPASVMQEVLTIAGPTAVPQAGFPSAVREWCINTAAIDPYSKSALVNSEDGVLYRWDFTTNTFTQRIMLTAGLGEAYTPTAIGIDGTVYAINDAILFAVGN